MNVKELKRILQELPEELEIVFGEKNPFEGYKIAQFKTLKKVKTVTVDRSVSGNYYPENGFRNFETKKAKVLEMLYD